MLQPIYIEWLDSVSDENKWCGEGEVNDWINNKEGDLIKTVGFKMKETKRHLIIFSHVNPQLGSNTKFLGVMKIPKGCIVKRKAFTIT